MPVPQRSSLFPKEANRFKNRSFVAVEELNAYSKAQFQRAETLISGGELDLAAKVKAEAISINDALSRSASAVTIGSAKVYVRRCFLPGGMDRFQEIVARRQVIQENRRRLEQEEAELEVEQRQLDAVRTLSGDLDTYLNNNYSAFAPLALEGLNRLRDTINGHCQVINDLNSAILNQDQPIHDDFNADLVTRLNRFNGIIRNRLNCITELQLFLPTIVAFPNLGEDFAAIHPDQLIDDTVRENHNLQSLRTLKQDLEDKKQAVVDLDHSPFELRRGRRVEAHLYAWYERGGAVLNERIRAVTKNNEDSKKLIALQNKQIVQARKNSRIVLTSSTGVTLASGVSLWTSLPIIGTVVSGANAIRRAWNGEYKQAGIDVISAVASSTGYSLAATAISAGNFVIDTYQHGGHIRSSEKSTDDITYSLDNKQFCLLLYGFDRDAKLTKNQLDKKHKQILLLYHPDKCSTLPEAAKREFEEQLRIYQTAYQILRQL